MKIYTKQGDTGMTSILGGIRLPKNHVRIEAYGTVDELNSNIGMLRDQDIDAAMKKELIQIQEKLFTIGSHLATDKTQTSFNLPEINESDVEMLEKSIDAMDEVLPEMKNFVLPGGHTAVSACHLSRCVCRRAERWTMALGEIAAVDPILIKYLNRLSDYLFVLSRKITHDKGVKEIPWKGN